MRARDRHFFLVLVAMLAVNLLTSAACVLLAFYYRHLFRELSVATKDKVESCEKASVEASSTALALLDYVRAGGGLEEDVAESPPVVLGYGQTRSKSSFWIYRDVRYSDGEVRREFLSKIPFGMGNAP